MSITSVELRRAPDRLSTEDLQFYEENGYVVFRDVLSPQEVEDTREAMKRVCLEAVEGLAAGTYNSRKGREGTTTAGWTLSDKNSRFSVMFERALELEDLTPDVAPCSYRKLASYMDKDPVFEELGRNPLLQAYRDQLLGPDSTLFQAMALSKPARIGVEKPWHQDNAYFKVAPLDQVLGIWIAIDDATVENGCMHVLPTRRSDLAAYKHVHYTDCEIDRGDLDMDRVVPVEVPAGGALFFLGMMPHQTPPNRSDHGRRALQLHYKGADTRELELEEYRKTFATPDGRPAACGEPAAVQREAL